MPNIKLTYSTERDSITDAIFLDANESYRQWVKADHLDLHYLNRYPDNSCRELRSALCRDYTTAFTPDQVLFSAGSIELIDLVLRTFCKKGLLLNQPCYQLYEIKAAQNNLPTTNVVMRSDFSIDIGRLREASRSVDVLLLINPNNPTGSLVSPRMLEDILTFFKGIIIIDEAYIEFAGSSNSLARFALSHPNVLVLRSFSKAWGLAGIRLGYVLGGRRLIATLSSLKNTYNVSAIAQHIGLGALEQRDGLDKYVSECLQAKKDLLRELNEQGMDAFDTHANFVLVRTRNSKALHDHLRGNGILVRHRGDQPLLNDMLRITVGASTENQKLVRAIEDFYA